MMKSNRYFRWLAYIPSSAPFIQKCKEKADKYNRVDIDAFLSLKSISAEGKKQLGEMISADLRPANDYQAWASVYEGGLTILSTTVAIGLIIPFFALGFFALDIVLLINGTSTDQLVRDPSIISFIGATVSLLVFWKGVEFVGKRIRRYGYLIGFILFSLIQIYLIVRFL